jgi:c-di-GMP-binding flagellar brake protein YcgR
MHTEPNQRQHPRVTLFESARYITGQRQQIHADLLNVSVSGLALLTDRALPVGEGFDVSFVLPNPVGLDHRIFASARVRHSRHVQHRMAHASGLEFEGLDEETRSVLEGFVERETSSGQEGKESGNGSGKELVNESMGAVAMGVMS